jgi:integrase
MKLISGKHDLPDGKSDIVLFDDDLRGFALRVRRGAGDRIIRNWLIAYRAGGHQRRMIVGDATILTAAQARDKAKKLLAKVLLGEDPQGERHNERAQSEVTLRSTIDRFLAAKKNAKPNTLRQYQITLLGPFGKRAIERGQKPYLAALHNKALHKIERRHVSDCLLNIAQQSGHPTAKLVRAMLSGLFSWSMSMGLTEGNPVVNSYKPDKQASGTRVLTARTSEKRSGDELALIWKAVDGDYGALIKLLILTACRRGEIAGMRWSEFSDDKSIWTLPAARAKNGTELTLPVTPLMREVIDTIYERDGIDYLFGKKGFSDWSGSKNDLDDKLTLKESWRVHDIRRSVATGMADIGIAPHVIETILNHRSGHKAGIAEIYNKSSYWNEVKQAMALWSEHIRALVDGTERKVVPLQRA